MADDAVVAELSQRRPVAWHVQPVGDVEEHRAVCEVLARRSSSTFASAVRLRALRELGTAAEPDDADRADVALEQGVHGLGRRVGDELDLLGADLRGDVGDALHDAGRHAASASCVVGTTDSATIARVEVDGHGLGERSADVDADADRHALRPLYAGAAVGAIGRGATARRGEPRLHDEDVDAADDVDGR